MALHTGIPRYRFGRYELDAATHELRCDGKVVRLQRQPAMVLGLLVSRAGTIVSREDIQAAVWKGRTFVDFESGLNFCIRQIRTALKENASSPLYVETIPRVGYRFFAPVEVQGLNLQEPAPELTEPASPPPSAPETVYIATAPERPRRKSSSVLGIAAALTVVSALVAFGIRSLPAWRQRAPELLSVQRLTQNGRVFRLAISPNGQYIAYMKRDDDGRSLWLRHVSTGSEKQLLPSAPGMFGLLKFSSNGSFLYYARVDSDGHGLYRIPLLGGDPQLVASVTPYGFGISKDDRMIAVLEKSTSGYSLRTIDSGTKTVRDVATLPATNYYVDALTTLSFLPDGSQIAFPIGKPAGKGAIVSVALKDGKIRELELPFAPEHAMLIPGEKSFLLSAPMTAQVSGRFWIQPLNGGPARMVGDDPSQYPLFDIAADGKTVVAVQLTGFFSLSTGNASGRPEHTVTTLTDPFPRLRWLGSTRIAVVGEAGKLDVLDSATGSPVHLTDDHTLRITPCPDLKRLVLLRRASGQKPSLWLLDTSAGTMHQATEGEDADPKCSADGKWIYYTHFSGASPSLWRISTVSAAKEQIALGGFQLPPQFDYYFDYSVSPGPSPNGDVIAVRGSKADGHPSLAFISTSTGELMSVIPIPPDTFDWRWQGSRRFLTFLNAHDPNWNMFQLDPDTGHMKKLTDVTNGDVTDYDWSDSGKLAILSGVRISDAVTFSLR